jgi:hypothetical protein
MKKERTPARVPHWVPEVVMAASPEERRAEDLTRVIKQELASVAQSFWRVGCALREIQGAELHRALGYASFSDYITDRLSFEVSQAYKLVRVASSYFQEDAEALGLERAAALIRYAKLLNVDPGQLVRENAQVGDKLVVAASKRDIQAAAASLRAEMKKRLRRGAALRAQRLLEKSIQVGLAAALKRAKLPPPSSVRIDPRSGDVVIRLPQKPLASRFGA